MIVRNLIDRPVAVSMFIVALMVVGIVSFKYIPISLMPDIDIPQITVQVSYPGASVREMESKVLRPLRNQLMQVNGLKSIRSESRTDAGAVFMSFEPGSNIDLLFIEVNEKMDRAVNAMPKEMERPKVLKASATDIPAFYLDLTIKDETTGKHGILPAAGVEFAQLGDFARNIVSKRIEQLPQTAMVDISGVVSSELLCVPDEKKMKTMGISTDVLEKAISDNNITLGVLSIADGLYRYNIHFDSQLMTREDIENIYINHNGRIFQFKDLCQVIEKPAKRKGLVRNGRNNAVSMAIIKQNDAQMEDLQHSIANLIKDLEEEYPNVRFQLTRDQTQLLTYSIENLKDNLLIGALLACLVLFLFIRNFRLPFLIIITIPLSLVLTLLCFHLLGITLNIISLSGLILGLGMMVDNSIIVIDNITQRWKKGANLKELIPPAVREVFSPMLSSVLTTCSVFIPLVFLSGISGALFYDQAMAVTLGLFASLLIAVLVIPVYYYLFFKNKEGVDTNEAMTERIRRWWHGLWGNKSRVKHRHFSIYKPYERILRWVMRHQYIVLGAFIVLIPLSFVVYTQVEKSRLPYIEYDDALMIIDWNAGISVEENDRRVDELLSKVRDKLTTSTTMVGVQDFLLAHTKEITASEAVVYLKTSSMEELDKIKTEITEYVKYRYPKAVVEFEVSGNIFDMIFSGNEADLLIMLQDKNGECPTVKDLRYFIDTLTARFEGVYIPPLLTEENIRYEADIELMSFYGVSYEAVFGRLRQLVNQRDLYKISHSGSSIPVTLGSGRKESRDLLMSKVKNKNGVEIPLSYIIKESKGEDFKKLYSGSGGDYYPVEVTANDATVREMVDFVRKFTKQQDTFYATFAGEYYSSRQMIGELALILLVAIALLYFIMAAQFESLIQPLIILSEITIDLFFVLTGLYLLGESINIMSLIGMVVMSGIVINDSILKVDTINRLRRGGMSLLRAIMTGGRSRLKPILMTSLTTILAITPFLYRVDMGSALQFPLSLSIIIGMFFGTLVSLFFIPLIYYVIYRKKA